MAAISDNNGRLVCATPSTHRATCPDQTCSELTSTVAGAENYTEGATPQNALDINGINSNAESYLSAGLRTNSAMNLVEFDTVQVSFSTPFIYAPPSNQFPSSVLNEDVGYIPQSLIDRMAQNSEYALQCSEMASCLPGGPSVDVYNFFCPLQAKSELAHNVPQSELTVSFTVTIFGQGCFHPGACPTPAASPGATAALLTPTVTLSQPLPVAGETQGSTPIIPSQALAVKSSPNALLIFPNPRPPKAAGESPSAPTATGKILRQILQTIKRGQPPRQTTHQKPLAILRVPALS